MCRYVYMYIHIHKSAISLQALLSLYLGSSAARILAPCGGSTAADISHGYLQGLQDPSGGRGGHPILAVASSVGSQ